MHQFFFDTVAHLPRPNQQVLHLSELLHPQPNLPSPLFFRHVCAPSSSTSHHSVLAPAAPVSVAPMVVEHAPKPIPKQKSMAEIQKEKELAAAEGSHAVVLFQSETNRQQRDDCRSRSKSKKWRRKPKRRPRKPQKREPRPRRRPS
jgi:hypothetical protein